MVALTIAGTVATFKYVDDQTNNALSSYAKHRLETTADYVTNGAWKKLFRKTNEKLKGKSIEEDPNIQFIDDILNKTKLQTDDSLIELWASLLANALQGKKSVRREYFDILSNLNPYDVLVMSTAFSDKYLIFVDDLSKTFYGNYNEREYVVEKFLSDNYDLKDEDEIKISINHLENIGILNEKSDLDKMYLTTLGRGLKKALSV